MIRMENVTELHSGERRIYDLNTGLFVNVHPLHTFKSIVFTLRSFDSSFCQLQVANDPNTRNINKNENG